MSKSKGFTLLEVLVAVVLIAIISFGFIEVLKPDIDREKKDKTIQIFNDLDKALRLHYRRVIEYRKQNAWELADDCTYDRSWILPNGCINDNNYLYLWKDTKILNAFEDAGCKLKETTNSYYKVECYDGWNRPLEFEFENLDNSHSVPYNPLQPITIKIKSAGKDGSFGTEDDLTYIFSTAPLDDRYINESYTILNKIRHALDGYFRYRFSVEVAERTYPNGLAEEDDMKVDWYLQLCTDIPYAYCEDDTCSNISAQWGTYTCGNDIKTNSCDIEKILTNLNIPSSFKKDAFGNPIYINLCYDGNDDGYPNGDSPSSHDDKAPFIASVSNGIITVLSSGE